MKLIFNKKESSSLNGIELILGVIQENTANTPNHDWPLLVCFYEWMVRMIVNDQNILKNQSEQLSAEVSFFSCKKNRYSRPLRRDCLCNCAPIGSHSFYQSSLHPSLWKWRSLSVSVWRQTLVKSEPLLISLALSPLGVHTAMGGREGRERGREGEKRKKRIGMCMHSGSGLCTAFLLTVPPSPPPSGTLWVLFYPRAFPALTLPRWRSMGDVS